MKRLPFQFWGIRIRPCAPSIVGLSTVNCAAAGPGRTIAARRSVAMRPALFFIEEPPGADHPPARGLGARGLIEARMRTIEILSPVALGPSEAKPLAPLLPT